VGSARIRTHPRLLSPSPNPLFSSVLCAPYNRDKERKIMPARILPHVSLRRSRCMLTCGVTLSGTTSIISLGSLVIGQSGASTLKSMPLETPPCCRRPPPRPPLRRLAQTMATRPSLKHRPFRWPCGGRGQTSSVLMLGRSRRDYWNVAKGWTISRMITQ